MKENAPMYNEKKDRTSWLLFISIWILTGIGFYTGYNTDILNNKTENIIHVGLVFLSIGFVLVYMIWRGLMLKHFWWSLLMVISAVGFTVYATINKIPHHTYWVEVYFFAIIYLYLLLFNVKIKVIDRNHIK